MARMSKAQVVKPANKKLVTVKSVPTRKGNGSPKKGK